MTQTGTGSALRYPAVSVAEGLNTRFPPRPPFADALPRRSRRSVLTRQIQPASPELLRRVLDGLQRL
jgi:hypothetical protein